MDRSFEEIRAEVFALDSESQLRLAHEIEDRLQKEDPAFVEAERRSQAVDRGEMKTVDGPEAIERVRRIVRR
jgi:hypothetical protein